MDGSRVAMHHQRRGTPATEDKMIDGIMVNGMVVPFIAVAALICVWVIVLYGSSYFGPR